MSLAGRWRLGLVAAALVLAGCGLLPPPGENIAAIQEWSGSAAYAEDGTTISATYEGWPSPIAPDVFACANAPASVFGPMPASQLLIASDPGCVRFRTELNGGTLRTSLDRATLPPPFAGLGSWTVVLARATDNLQWSISKTMPADFPGPS